jgi:two-component system, OmpR family, KDP operon response regulator KdpE
MLSVKDRNEPVVLCGAPDAICNWHRLLATHLSESPLTIAALQRHSPHAVTQLLAIGVREVVSCDADTGETVERIRSAVNRHKRSDNTPQIVPTLVTCQPAEVRLYAYLRHNQHRVVSQVELIHRVFGGAHSEDTSLVRVHIAMLRKKLGPNRNTIRTARGKGYYYRPAPTADVMAGLPTDNDD